MRVGLLLKSHLFAHNFSNVPTPACPCGHRNQNEKHFFLDCTLLAANRAVLLREFESLNVDDKFSNLNKINKIKFLLYGNPNLTVYVNDKIIEATSQFIVNNKNAFAYIRPNNNNNININNINNNNDN